MKKIAIRLFAIGANIPCVSRELTPLHEGVWRSIGNNQYRNASLADTLH